MAADTEVREAAKALLKAIGSEWDCGNCYISRAFADNNNAAMRRLRKALAETEQPESDTESK